MSKNNNGWAPHLISRVEEIDIDPEIEKEIAQLEVDIENLEQAIRDKDLWL